MILMPLERRWRKGWGIKVAKSLESLRKVKVGGKRKVNVKEEKEEKRTVTLVPKETQEEEETVRPKKKESGR